MTTRKSRDGKWVAHVGLCTIAAAISLCSAKTFAATDVTGFISLETSDAGSADSSFAQGAHWSDGDAPSQGKSYYVPAGKLIFLPAATDNPEFQGDVLAVAGMAFMSKTTSGAADSSITIGDLRLMGGAILTNVLTRSSVSLYGNVTVEATSSSPAAILNQWPQGDQRSLNIMGSLKGEANAFLRIARTRKYASQPYLPMPDFVVRMSGDWSEYCGKLQIGSYGGVSAQSDHPLSGGVEVQSAGWWVFDKPSCGELIVGNLDLQANSTVLYQFAEGVSAPAYSQYFTVTNTFSHGAAKIQIKGNLLALGCAYTNFPLIRLEGPAAAANLNAEAFVLDISNVDEGNLTARLGPYPESPHVALVAREENGAKILYLEVGEPVVDSFIKMTVHNGNYKEAECAFYTGHESWWSNNQFPELGPQNDNTYLALKQLTFVTSNTFGPDDYDLSGARLIMTPGYAIFFQAKSLRLKELHLTAAGTSGGYPASYGLVSYSHATTKHFYGNSVTHKGNSDTHYVYNRVADNCHVWLYGEISGDGNVDFFSTKYASSFQVGNWHLYNVATNFHAVMRLSSSKHSHATEEYVHFYLNDARALGGSYAGTYPWRSIWFSAGFYHITDDVDLTESSRGLFLEKTNRIEVPDGKRFAVRMPTTFYGVVNKVGDGLLALGGEARFSNSGGTANTVAPAQDKNVLNVLEGSLCVAVSNAVDGVALNFSAGASLVIPADSEDEMLKEKGLYNVKWSAPLSFADQKLKVVFTNAVESAMPEDRFSRGICTIKRSVAQTLGLSAESFDITPPFRSQKVKLLGVSSSEDGAADTVTYTARFGLVGSMFILR